MKLITTENVGECVAAIAVMAATAKTLPVSTRIEVQFAFDEANGAFWKLVDEVKNRNRDFSTYRGDQTGVLCISFGHIAAD